ncbi:MAG: methionyl-tRNA synthetase [Parachlamydiales bacterium]|nr:methionyl-tRNA synthetase [Parachlamydiales bacterium]
MPRHLITSALPYINGVKHLGNLIGSILPADVYSRYLRQQGEEVLFICGVDEHGTPAEIAAENNRQSVEEYCTAMFTKQKDIYERFEISFDHFGRSSSKHNHKLTQHFFIDLYNKGHIYKKTIEQFYSEKDQRFLPDRYVQGTCPHCGYEQARGDQCDGCCELLDPAELINPYSSLSGDRAIKLRTTEHFFLRLSGLQETIEEWVKTRTWSRATQGIALKWIKEGLKDRCITRDLKWGIPVPLEGYEDKVFYVWFDAPNAYIGITQDWAEQENNPLEWERWWKPSDPQDVHYTQFMAKDNVPFHAIFWPAVLLAIDKNWKLVDTLHSFSWLNYEDGKFSTSRGRGIFTDTALEEFPSDYWRYYLLSITPESQDSSFTIEGFVATINKDLADVLGNFVSRTTTFVDRYFDGRIPQKGDGICYDEKLFQEVKLHFENLGACLENLRYREAIKEMRSLFVLGNLYFTEKEPWNLIKTDRDQTAQILHDCLFLIYCFAVACAPIIPTTSRKLFTFIGEEGDPSQIPFSFLKTAAVHFEGRKIIKAPKLFEKIDSARTEEIKNKFSGDQALRKQKCCLEK